MAMYGITAISIHALREEGDSVTRFSDSPYRYFYPRPPRGGRQELTACIVRRDLFLSTPSSRRATWRSSSVILFFGISIHALREEGDPSCFCGHPGRGNFYPRPPRGGRRRCTGYCLRQQHFYPRPPRGGRLSHCPRPCSGWHDFYPRPPRGGRRWRPRVLFGTG